MAKKMNTIELHKVKLETLNIVLLGDSSLIISNFAAKSLGAMFAKQVNSAWEKMPKDPGMDYDGASYYIDDNGDEIGGKPSLSLIVKGHIPEYVSS